jgi:hypothetical protein
MSKSKATQTPPSVILKSTTPACDSIQAVPPDIEFAWRMGVTIQALRRGDNTNSWLDVDTYEEFTKTNSRLRPDLWEFRIKPRDPEVDAGDSD